VVRVSMVPRSRDHGNCSPGEPLAELVLRPIFEHLGENPSRWRKSAVSYLQMPQRCGFSDAATCHQAFDYGNAENAHSIDVSALVSQGAGLTKRGARKTSHKTALRRRCYRQK